MGCFESPECEPFFKRKNVSGIACFLGGKSQSSNTKQTAANSQVGVQGGTGVGSGNTGTVAGEGGINIITGYNKNTGKGSAGSGATTINVNETSDNAAENLAAFSTIDHLISLESNATPGTSPDQLAENQPSSASPVIITTGGGNGSGQTSGATATGGTNWTVIAAVGGLLLAAIVFIHTKGKAS
jgi:hypothetical protein